GCGRLAPFPQLDGAVETAADHAAAVGGEGDRAHRLLVALQGPDRAPGLGVPELDRGVVGTRRDDLAVRGVGDGAHPPGVGLHGANELAAWYFPEFQGLVPAPADENASVQRKGQASDPVLEGGLPPFLRLHPEAAPLDRAVE